MTETFKHKKGIIIGGTSGIGLEVAKLLHKDNWTLGIAGRREHLLQEIKSTLGNNVHTKQIDVCSTDAVEQLLSLLDEVGDVELIFITSGIGFQNPQLNTDIELSIAKTNVEGFTRIITTAYNYFAQKGFGHIAAISSIAGTKGLGAAPAYSATKRFQNIYIQSLAQHASIYSHHISFTDIRLGFVDTALLSDGKHYPMLMKPTAVAKNIVKAIYSRKRVITFDWRYKILVFFWRLIPDYIWEHLKIRN